MAGAPTKPLHKPSESHTLDEVLKALQDLIRNELVEPQAGQERDVAKRSVAPPKITPTVKPASRWEARGLGKAKLKPADEVDVDAVLDSLRDIVTQELAVHTPRKAREAEAAPEPAPVANAENPTPDDAELRIEWAESLDAAAAALVPDTGTETGAGQQFPSTEHVEPPDRVPTAADEQPLAETPAATVAKDVGATDVPPVPEEPVNAPAATTPAAASPKPSGEQHTFLFDSNEASTQQGLPTLDVTHEVPLELAGLPETIELDELTHARSPETTADRNSPAEITETNKAAPDAVIGESPSGKSVQTIHDVDAQLPPTETATDQKKLQAVELAPPPDTALTTTEKEATGNIEPTSPADYAQPPSENTPSPRAAEDFNTVTPANVGSIPSIDFVPSGASIRKQEPTAVSSAPKPEASAPSAVDVPAVVVEGPEKSTAERAAPTQPAMNIPSEAPPSTPAPAAPTTKVAAAEAPAPSVTGRPVREIAVRTIAKLNIELRRCGERTLDPRMVDRLQFVLQELLGGDSKKPS